MAEGIRKRVSDRTGRVTYEGSVYIARGGVRVRRTFPTMAAARSWRVSALKAVKDGALRGPSGITFREAAEQWIAEAESGRAVNRSGQPYKPSAASGYRKVLKRHVLPQIGALRLEDVTRGVLQHMVDEWAAKGVAGNTIRNQLMPVRVVFRRAVRRGLVAINPCDRLELPPPGQRRERIATPAEARVILDALPEAERCTWALALYAGLRSGEIQGLRWSDVDLTGARLTVARAWDPKHHLYVAPKSKAGRRTVPVASVLRRQLEQHQQATGRDGDDLVVGRTAEAPMTNATALIRGRRACESAGVKRLGLHEARHTAVSLWIAAGMNLRAVSTYAGHASVAFTLDRYGHLLPDDQERAVELLDAFLGD